VFPKWFIKKYPDVERSLRANRDKRLSMYDIYATLRQVRMCTVYIYIYVCVDVYTYTGIYMCVYVDV